MAKKRYCCGADRTWFGPTVERHVKGRWRTSKRVYHQRGEEFFWHWQDQRLRLHKDYRLL
jgi:hypothetical protein